MSGNKIIGPALPPGFSRASSDEEEDENVSKHSPKEAESSDEDFGPALPPGFKAEPSTKAIGPTIPDNIDDEDSDDEVYGPVRADETDVNHQYDASKRLVKVVKEESRREKWMLDPPTALRKTLPTQSVTKFNQKSSTSKPVALTKEQKLELEAIAQKDEKNKDFLRKYEKDNKRNVSLLDQHRENQKNKKPKTEKVERREFDRDQDLNVPRINDKAKKKFLNEASTTFGTRFSSGKFEKFL